MILLNNDNIAWRYDKIYQSRSELLNSDIKQWYDTYKHVRKVPYHVMKKRLMQNDLPPEQHLGEWLNYVFSKSHSYVLSRQFCKIWWLVNDILKNKGINHFQDPLHVKVYPREQNTILLDSKGFDWHRFYQYNNDISLYRYSKPRVEFRGFWRPGVDRRCAFELVDEEYIDCDVIVYDGYNVFPEYPKINLEEILNMYDDEANVFSVNIITYDSIDDGIPCLVNYSDKGFTRNGIIENTLEDYMRFIEANDEVHIFIRNNNQEKAETCRNSIERFLWTSDSKVKIHYLESQHDISAIPLLCNFRGIAIFVEEDYIFTENILNILFYIDMDNCIACVDENNPSLLLINNSHMDCKKFLGLTDEKLYNYICTNKEKFVRIPKRWQWIADKDSVLNIHDHYGLSWPNGVNDTNGQELFEYYKYRDEECTKWQIDLRDYEIIDENHITTNSAPSWLKTK